MHYAFRFCVQAESSSNEVKSSLAGTDRGGRGIGAFLERLRRGSWRRGYHGSKSRRGQQPLHGSPGFRRQHELRPAEPLQSILCAPYGLRDIFFDAFSCLELQLLYTRGTAVSSLQRHSYVGSTHTEY